MLTGTVRLLLVWLRLRLVHSRLLARGGRAMLHCVACMLLVLAPIAEILLVLGPMRSTCILHGLGRPVTGAGLRRSAVGRGCV